MADRHRSLVDFAQRVAREHLRHQSVVLVRLHHAIIVDDNAAALLTAVLQGIQRMIRLRDDALVGGIRAVNAEHAALLVQLVVVERVGRKRRHHAIIIVQHLGSSLQPRLHGACRD